MARTLFAIVVAGMIAERLLEVWASKRNMRKLLALGGRESASGHYPAIILMHVCFFCSAITEWQMRGEPLPDYWPVPLIILLLAGGLRLWSRRALAGRWTTRIVTLPNQPLVTTGPYKFLSHPIYVCVIVEIASMPMIFGLVFTAITFSVLNAIMLFGFRIPAERRALDAVARNFPPARVS